MLVIIKSNELYSHYTVSGITAEQWLEAVGDGLPEGFIVAIDEGHKHYAKILTLDNYRPVLNDDGELVDVVELDPIPVEMTPQEKLSQTYRNIRNTDSVILDRVAKILPELERLANVESTATERRELSDVMEKRQKWNAEATQLEMVIKKQLDLAEQ